MREHPFAFSVDTPTTTLIQPTLPALVHAARGENVRAGDCTIFPLYRIMPKRYASVLTHIYAERTYSGWRWRSSDDIRKRAMVYYYVPTEALVRAAIRRHATRCVILPICDLSGTAGVEVQVKAPDTVTAAVGTELAQMFPNNTIEYAKIDNTVRYRIAVRNVYEN